MAWSPDPELHQMFLDELDERLSRISSGATAMVAGDMDAIDLSAMRREGHTVKGTARVMGYEAVGLAAGLIEEVWDRISSGDVDPSAVLGDALLLLSAQLELAGRESPQSGSASLVAAVARLHDLAPGTTRPELPEPATIIGENRANTQAGSRHTDDETDGVEDVEVLPSREIPDRPNASFAVSPESKSASRREPPDLPVEYGGVIGAVESWATEGTVIVNAGRLYRLINRIAATRAETAALAEVARQRNGDRTDIENMSDGVARAMSALQSDVLGLASLPLSTLTGSLPQLVKYLSKKLGKNIELTITGDRGVVIDRQVLETISEPVRQLIVNAIYHGLEIPGRRKDQRKPNIGSLTLDVALKDNMLDLVIADDGAGVDWEAVHNAARGLDLVDKDAPPDEETLTPILFEPGFTTGAIEGGRGDGLTRLAGAVEDLHGRVQFETWPGAGTRVTIRVPAWQALQRVLIVFAGGMRWAIPEAAVERSMSRAEAGVDLGEVQQMEWDGRHVTVMPFAASAGVEPTGEEAFLIMLSHRVGTAGFSVDSVVGSFEVAVTELAPLAAGPNHVTGVALLGAGEVALVIDAGKLIERTRVIPSESRPRSRVLVVDDSDGGRAILSGSLSSSGFSTSVAGSVAEAVEMLANLEVDALVVDFSLPSASGVALVEEVRRRDRHMPIVMISGHASEDDKVRAKEAGVDRFFDKSDFRDGALVTALWDLLER